MSVPVPSRQLLRLINLPLSRCIVDYLVGLSIDVVNHGLGRPPVERGRSASRNASYIKFRQFVDNLVHRAEVTVPMLLVTAVYIARSRPFISIARPDWAFERVFLGALVVATKYHNDRSLKNHHWSAASGVFSPRDVSRIEREILDVLNYELRVSEEEFLTHEAPLLSAFNSPDLSKTRHSWWKNNSAVPDDDDDDSGESSMWSESDNDCDSDEILSSSSDISLSPPSDDSLSPSTPLTPLSTFPLPPNTTISPTKRATYPGLSFPIPTLRASLSC